jgi:CelD/BcsL family acetyltransferase involved in cellulose biosynthesis
VNVCTNPPASSNPEREELTGKVVRPGELSEDERAAWKGLCQNSQIFANPFFSVSFSDALAACGVDIRVCVLKNGGRPVGFFPYQFANRFARSLSAAERAGEEMSDYCGLIADSDFQIEPRQLLSLSRISSFTFSHLDETQKRYGLSGEKPEAGLMAQMPRGGAAYWQEICERDKALASDTKRRLRRLTEQYGPLRFVFGEESPHGFIEDLIKKKRSQYKRTGKTDSLSKSWKRRLLHRVADFRDPDFTGVLSTLHAGDTWVASHFGIRSRNVLHYWFPIYNREMEKFSPGRLLYKSIVEATDVNGITVIDRGAGDALFKKDFCNAAHTYLRGRWQRPGLKSLAFSAAMSAKWRFGSWR